MFDFRTLPHQRIQLFLGSRRRRCRRPAIHLFVRPVFALRRTSVGRLPFTHHFIRIVTKPNFSGIFFFIRRNEIYSVKAKTPPLCVFIDRHHHMIPVSFLYSPPPLPILPVIDSGFPFSPFLATPFILFERGGEEESKWEEEDHSHFFWWKVCMCVCHPS